METIRDSLIQLAFDNWQLFALAAVAVAALGTLLGSLKAGENGTAAVLSKKGLRVAVPLTLACSLVATGYLLGASKAPKVEHIASSPKIATRDVVKEVEEAKEIKEPTIIEKIVGIPARVFKSPANAKCYFCAALLNVDSVPLAGSLNEGIFRCGGCGCQIEVPRATHQFLFNRKGDLVPHMGLVLDISPFPVVMPVGRDPVYKPKLVGPPYEQERLLRLWEEQKKRFIERD